ncbi:Retrograde transporter protein [Neofusicoccum parvum]|uniref:Putative retrograde transporter protein n=1 Tax=Botryosphaeria parva (strain UCR-NP2) TaxID=1287680 RepID=R1EJ22_BOTPV|nr:putative retrograde transporter protein [Neofusicoccum parvum UCRNP2]GME65363.1 Retrograde transporter protein [Neofusicoccum parvum]
MHSVFRLPWSTENPAMDKAQFHQVPKQRPVVDIPLLSKLKRKRTDSPEPCPPAYSSQHVAKKWKYANGSEVRPVVEIGKPDRPAVDAPTPAPAPTSLPRVKSSGKPSDASAPGTGAKPLQIKLEDAASTPALNPPPTSQPSAPAQEEQSAAPSSALEVDPTAYSPLQQAIETHFNQEILLKHNELRLIEQELAKCQVALEQIRRCQLIPYPGTDAASTDVSCGVGPALQPRHGFTTPEQPAPWGVTDGPYSRHYAKWLIPDPKFDSVSVASLHSGGRAHSGLSEGRATRGSLAELPMAGKSRSSRASAGSKLQALGDPSAPKIDPLLHKRSTDGKWVRLFCHHPDCRHSNFSNTQGFLNHCRIKHNQKFESHDQAAVECGIPVDVNELGVVLPNSEASPSTPAAAAAPNLNGPFVHPLIKSNPPTKSKPLPPRALPKKDAPVSSESVQTPVAKPKLPSSFVPSPQTPMLNALLQRQGFAGDLNQLVDFARTKVDLVEMDTEESDDDAERSPVKAPKSTASVKKGSDASLRGSGPPLSRLPARGGMAPASLATTGLHPASGAPPRLQHSSSSASSTAGGNLESPTMELSPHTLDSAPGLVTDHEDDDDDEEDGGSVTMRDEDYGVDNVVVEDGSDVERDARRAKSVEGFVPKAGSSRK